MTMEIVITKQVYDNIEYELCPLEDETSPDTIPDPEVGDDNVVAFIELYLET